MNNSLSKTVIFAFCITKKTHVESVCHRLEAQLVPSGLKGDLGCTLFPYVVTPKWTQVDLKWVRGGLRFLMQRTACGPKRTRSGLGVDSVSLPCDPKVDPRGLGGDSVLMSITIQFLREGTRTPFGLYNNIRGWGGESPRTLPYNIVLGPHCPKRGWSNSFL